MVPAVDNKGFKLTSVWSMESGKGCNLSSVSFYYETIHGMDAAG